MATRTSPRIHLAVLGAVLGMCWGVRAVLNRPASGITSAAESSSAVAALPAVSTAGGESSLINQPVWREVLRAHLAAKRFHDVDQLVRTMPSAADQGDAVAYIVGMLVDGAADYNLDQSEAEVIGSSESDDDSPPEAEAFKEVRRELLQIAEAIEDSGVRARSLARIAFAEVLTRQSDETTVAAFAAMNAAYGSHQKSQPTLWDRLTQGWKVIAQLGMVGSLGALFTSLLVNAVWYYVETLACWIWGEKGVSFIRKVHSSGVDPVDVKASAVKSQE